MAPLYVAIGTSRESARASIEAVGPAALGSTPTPGQVLTWNGTVWVPTTPSGATPALSAVLVVGNTTGATDLLQTLGQRFDTDVAGTLNLGTATATALAVGNAPAGIGTFQVFINQGGVALHGSGSGVQYASTTSSRAQYRVGQYGNHTGVPGISSFKSRGLTVGALAPVQVGDVLFRDTAVGVTDNLSIPLSGMISVNVTSVPAASGWIGTEFEVQLVPDEGPANGRRRSFAVSPAGIPRFRESVNSASGVATTGVGGTVVVASTRITASTRIALTMQDGGVVPTGAVWVSARTPGTDFTISSVTGDVGVKVYWQLMEPI